MSQSLKTELKRLIVETLNLHDVDPAGIKDDEPLFESGLGLDSIDALELVLSLEKRYGVKISSSEESRAALANVNTLASFIEERRPA
jgi:acyl carrier protein